MQVSCLFTFWKYAVYILGSENNTAEKKRRRLSVEINGSNVASSVSSGGKTEDDAGFISLPHTPTDLGLNLELKIATSGNSVASSVAGSTNSASTSLLADDGIFTSSEETLTNVMKKATSLDTCDISAANSR